MNPTYPSGMGDGSKFRSSFAVMTGKEDLYFLYEVSHGDKNVTLSYIQVRTALFL